MRTQPTTSSIATLIAVTLLTSISAALPGKAHALELSAQSANQPVDDLTRPHHDELPSADAVAAARWARWQDHYVLGEGGRIVPESRALEVIGAEPVRAARADSEFASDHNHFDSSFLLDSVHSRRKCGPSSVTPAEITHLVVEAAQRHKVDIRLAVAIVTAESRLDRLRNSPKGARGPMQLMPETAERFGVTDICDPAENIDGGVRYLRELSDEFRNPLLVAAAYNAGEGRVREHGGIPPFRETLGYVAEVMNIQMGIEESGPAPRERGSSAAVPEQPSNTSGVITSRKRRQWVGGVMHF